MFKKWGIAFLTTIFVVLSVGAVFLSGCTSNRVESPIKEPTPQTQQQADINQVIKELLPADAQLITAKNTKQKQSIFMEDIDQDNKQEAFVLYQGKNDNQQAHLLVLQEENGTWNQIWDNGTGFASFDYFALFDLDNNGTKEVVIGGAVSDTEDKKTLSIYEFTDNKFEEMVNHEYEMLSIDKWDNNQTPSILLLSGTIGDKQTAEIYSYENKSLQSLSSLELNPDASLEQVTFGKLADGVDAVFIDGGLGAHSMLTQILIQKEGKLVKVGEDMDGVLMKEYPLYSRDINGDGIIEVGGMYIPKGYEDAAMAEIPFIYTYNDYKADGSKQTIEERYVDEGQHFYITIPVNLYQQVTVKKLEDGVQLVSTTNQDILFEVHWRNKDVAGKETSKLAETLDTVYDTNHKDELAIPNQNFHLIEEDMQ